MKKLLFLGAFLSGTTFLFSQNWQPGSGILYVNPTSTNVGIGLSNPTYPLQINSLASNKGLVVGADGKTTKVYLHVAAGDYGYLQLSNGTILRGNGNISSFEGKVGIGTSSPSSTLSLFNNGTCGLHIDNNAFDWDLEAYNSGVFGGLFIKERGSAIASFYRDGGVCFSTGCLQVATRNLSQGYYGTASSMFEIIPDGTDNVLDYFKNINGGSTYFFKLKQNGDMFLAGKLTAQEIEVKANVWADYVFKPNYKLIPITELENYIKENSKLPDIPSETQVKDKGVNVGEMNALLLKKIEEQSLYIIELNKRIEALENKLNSKEKK